MKENTKQEEFECEEFHVKWYREFIEEARKIQEDLSGSRSEDLEQISINLMYVLGMLEGYIMEGYRKAYLIKNGKERAVIHALDMDDLRLQIDGLWDERDCTVFEVDDFPTRWSADEGEFMMDDYTLGREIKLPT